MNTRCGLVANCVRAAFPFRSLIFFLFHFQKNTVLVASTVLPGHTRPPRFTSCCNFDRQTRHLCQMANGELQFSLQKRKRISTTRLEQSHINQCNSGRDRSTPCLKKSHINQCNSGRDRTKKTRSTNNSTSPSRGTVSLSSDCAARVATVNATCHGL
jgi:hypothetical protein